MRKLYQVINSSLSRKIITISLFISLVPLITVSFFSEILFVDIIEKEKRNKLDSLAELRITQLESFLRNNINFVESTAQNTHVTGVIDALQAGYNDSKYSKISPQLMRKLSTYLGHVTDKYQFTGILITNKDGKIIYSFSDERMFGIDVNSPEHFRTGYASVFRSASTLLLSDISNFDVDRFSDGPCAYISAPIYSDKGLKGTFIVRLELGQVRNLAENYVGLGQTGEIVIAKKSETGLSFVFPTRHDRTAHFGKELPIGVAKALPIQNAVQGIEGFGEEIDYRDKWVLASWKYSPTLRWGFVFKMDKDEVFADIFFLRNVIITSILLAILLIFVMSSFFSKKITSPLVEVTEISKKLSEGRILTELKVKSNDEIGILMTSVNSMMASWKEKAEVLEKLALGIMDIRVSEKSDDDVIAISINKLIETLDDVVDQAHVISHGNYESVIRLRSENDMLGHSLQRMTRQLYSTSRSQKEAEEKFKQLFLAAEDAIVTIDEEGIIDSVNPAFYSMFEYEEGEIEGKNVKILMPEPHHSGHDSYLENYKKTGLKKVIGIGTETLAKTKLGREFPIYLIVNEYSVNGKKYYTGLARDLSAIKSAEAVVETQNYLKEGQLQIYLVMRDATASKDLLSNVIKQVVKYVNAPMAAAYLINDKKQLKRVAGYAYGKKIRKSETLEFGEGLVGQVALDQKPMEIGNLPEEFTNVRSGVGEIKPKSIFIVPIIFETRTIAVLEVATFECLTQLQHTYIKETAENLAIALNAANNRTKMQELLEKTQVQSEELTEQQDALQNSNRTLKEQAELLKASEEELKSQSEELIASNEELAHNAKILKEQKEAVEKTSNELEKKSNDLILANKYKSEFLANMSHELRTPLNSFLLLAGNLSKNKKGNLSQDQLEDLKIIHDGGMDLLELINDIMDLSKVEAGKLNLHLENVEVEAVITSLYNLFKSQAENKKLTFSVNIDENAPKQIHSDSLRIEQILKNFLANAFKFTEQGYVTLNVSRPEPDVVYFNKEMAGQELLAFTVSDSGIGIPEEKQKGIFEAFQQQDGSISRKYGGTGLGLNIAREMSQLLCGEIHLSSVKDKGSSFTLYLPSLLVSTNLDKNETEKGIKPAFPLIETSNFQNSTEPTFLADDRGNVSGDGEHVLIIEDDPKFANILLKIARKSGYKGLVAGDGKNGLYLATQHHPKGIFLDLGLPDMDGKEVLQQLKTQTDTQTIPVHVITARDVEQVSREISSQGLLAKPVSERDINRALETLKKSTTTDIKKVLIIESDDHVQKSLASMLILKDLEPETVSSGQEGIDKIIQTEYDFIILDLDLNDMSGFDVLKEVHTIEDIHLPPVIVCTEHEITVEERNALSQYSVVIILKNSEETEQLLDEALLFMHSISNTQLDEGHGIVFDLENRDQLLKGKNILLVDDDMRNIFALSKSLQDTGVKVYEADNGQTAIDKLNTVSEIDLIIMDIMMPIMDGYEAMKKIRLMPAYQNIPILALTAKVMPEDKEKCLNAGANDYLSKPVNVDQLNAMLKVWLFRKV